MRQELIAGLLTAATLTSVCASAQSQPPYPPSPAPAYNPYAPPVYAPTYAPYAPYAPPPAPEAPDAGESSDGSGLIIGGSITLGSFYLFSALSMAGLGIACDAEAPDKLKGELDGNTSMCGDGDPALGYIPFVGPFVAMGELVDTPVSVWPINVGLVALGLGQIAGAGLLIGGLATGSGEAPVSVQPMAGPGTGALAVTTRF